TLFCNLMSHSIWRGDICGGTRRRTEDFHISMSEQPRIAVIVVAGGKGERAGSGDRPPKQYQFLAGQPVLARTLMGFLALDQIYAVLPVIGEGHAELYAGMELVHPRLLPPVTGGGTRQ